MLNTVIYVLTNKERIAVVLVTELGLTAVIVGKKVLCPGSINQPVTDTDSKQPGNNTKRVSTSSLNRGEAVTTFQRYICEEDL